MASFSSSAHVKLNCYVNGTPGKALLESSAEFRIRHLVQIYRNGLPEESPTSEETPLKVKKKVRPEQRTSLIDSRFSIPTTGGGLASSDLPHPYRTGTEGDGACLVESHRPAARLGAAGNYGTPSFPVPLRGRPPGAVDDARLTRKRPVARTPGVRLESA